MLVTFQFKRKTSQTYPYTISPVDRSKFFSEWQSKPETLTFTVFPGKRVWNRELKKIDTSLGEHVEGTQIAQCNVLLKVVRKTYKG